MAAEESNDESRTSNPFHLIDFIPKFTGDDVTYSSTKWAQDLEDNSEIFGWSPQQKLIVARRCLSGTAELWLKTEKAFRTYEELKTALQKEFPEVINSKQMHEMMSTRKKQPNETYYQYMLVMKELGKRAKFPDYVSIQYIIDGIQDYESNKLLFYGVTTYPVLKEKLALYESFKQKSKTNFTKQLSDNRCDKLTKPKIHKEAEETVIRCYKCGEKGHTSNVCSKGVKCFKCNEYGHIASACSTTTVPEKSSRIPGISNHRRSMMVKSSTTEGPVNEQTNKLSERVSMNRTNY
ncbi:hypothetical protein ABMA27_015479 [Loxostege sticticalis]|uniref:CCHC-type domain-containing protein n=1 Tax=Loxostege sticticalis TaxID=481309 RepID=A0ABR3I7S7_LOXSC